MAQEPATADACQGALVGAAIGDAFGAPFEGRRGQIDGHEVDKVVARGSAESPLPITDDAVMTIGVAESLLARGDLDEDHLASTFASAYAQEPWRGYGGGAASLLRQIAAGEDWRHAAAQQFGGQGSFGNGAAMRSAPFGVVAAGDPKRAAALAGRAARVTHTHPLGVEGAAAQAAAVALLVAFPADEALDGAGLVAALGQLLTEPQLIVALESAADLAFLRASPSEISRTLGNGVSALEAVPAALCAFLRHSSSFADAVRFAISLGGDTDTIASMAGALAGARLGYSAIPTEWVERAESTDRLAGLASQLYSVQ